MAVRLVLLNYKNMSLFQILVFLVEWLYLFGIFFLNLVVMTMVPFRSGPGMVLTLTILFRFCMWFLFRLCHQFRFRFYQHCALPFADPYYFSSPYSDILISLVILVPKLLHKSLFQEKTGKDDLV